MNNRIEQLDSASTEVGKLNSNGQLFSDELMLHIFYFLPLNDFSSASLVSKLWNNLASDNALWKKW